MKHLITTEEQFAVIQQYIDLLTKKHSDLSKINGIKINRKQTLKINGEIFKLNHSFILIYDANQKQLVPYKLLHSQSENALLGQGSYGRVKLIEDQAGNKSALKVINGTKIGLGEHNDQKEFLSSEVAALQAMGLLEGSFQQKYPNFFIRIFRRLFGLVEYKNYIIMKCVEGQQLTTLLPTFNKADKYKVALSLLEQCHTLHQAGYAWLDAKSDNIICNKNLDGSIVTTVIDLGATQKLGTKLTVLGNLISMPPEMLDLSKNPLFLLKNPVKFAKNNLFAGYVQAYNLLKTGQASIFVFILIYALTTLALPVTLPIAVVFTIFGAMKNIISRTPAPLVSDKLDIYELGVMMLYILDLSDSPQLKLHNIQSYLIENDGHNMHRLAQKNPGKILCDADYVGGMISEGRIDVQRLSDFDKMMLDMVNRDPEKRPSMQQVIEAVRTKIDSEPLSTGRDASLATGASLQQSLTLRYTGGQRSSSSADADPRSPVASEKRPGARA